MKQSIMLLSAIVLTGLVHNLEYDEQIQADAKLVAERKAQSAEPIVYAHEQPDMDWTQVDNQTPKDPIKK